MFGYIYKTTNHVNQKVYIGKKESNEYVSNYYGSGYLLKKAIHKYGKENFTVEILDTADSLQELNEKEIHYISFYKNKLGANCYNLAEGGTGGYTIKHFSEDRRQEFSDKMKKINKDRCSKDEFKSKISESNRKRYLNPIERELQRERSIKGWKNEELLKTQSERQRQRLLIPENKEKLLEATRKRWRSESARENFKKEMDRIWTEEKRKEHSKLLKSKTTKERRLAASSHSKKMWQNESHRKQMSEKLRNVRLSEEVNKGAHARKIQILLIHHSENKLFDSRVEFENYCQNTYGFVLSNKTYRKLIETGSPFKSYYKKQRHMDGIIIKKLTESVETMGDECNPVE